MASVRRVVRLRDDTISDAEAEHPAALAQSSLLELACLLLGMSVALDRFVPLTLGPLTPTFAIGGAIGFLGWWTGVLHPYLRRFMAWIGGFVLFALISLVSNGAIKTVKSVGGIFVWLLLIPGIAAMLTDRRRLRALMIGLILGGAFLLTVVVARVATGHRALDPVYPQLLGLNRNAVDISIVWLLPLVLVSRTLAMPRSLKVVFTAAAILWLTSSQGRTGLVALLMVGPLLLLLKPPKQGIGITRYVVAAVGVGALYLVSSGAVSLAGVPALGRIDQYQHGQRTQADEFRLLLNKKSRSLMRRFPVFGVGFGRYEGFYDPVIETGRTSFIRMHALEFPGHNTYLEVGATTGIPGLALFSGALLAAVGAGIRRRVDDDVRACTAGLLLVLFTITFHSSYGTILYLPIALTLAAAVRASHNDTEVSVG